MDIKYGKTESLPVNFSATSSYLNVKKYLSKTFFYPLTKKLNNYYLKRYNKLING